MIKKSSFPRNFKYFREKANIGQEALAEKIGVNVRTISIYETGKGFPKVDLLFKISEVLQVPVEYFFVDDPENINEEQVPSKVGLLPNMVSNDVLVKIKEYRGLINAYRQLVESGDREACEKLISSFISAVDDLEASHIQNREMEAKLQYATQLISLK